MTALQSSMDIFTHPQQKPKKKDGRKKRMLLRYSLTEEGLIGRTGKVSDAIMLKACQFEEDDLVTKQRHEHKDTYREELWTVLPLPGNKTTYTVIVKDYGDSLEYSCNCQYATMQNRCCSHSLGVILVRGDFMTAIQIGFRGGVRPKKK